MIDFFFDTDIVQAQAAADSYRRREAHDESMLAKLVERDEEESAPIDLGRLVTRMVNDTYGQPVVIVDGLFSERELTAMRQHVEEQQLWSFDDVTHHDDGTYDNGDNVKWLGGANVAAYLETSVWRKTKRLMDAITSIGCCTSVPETEPSLKPSSSNG